MSDDISCARGKYYFPATCYHCCLQGGGIRRIIGLVFVAGLIGCDSATAPDTSYLGSYSLTSINGASLAVQKSDRIDYFVSTIWLDADRTYTAYLLSQSCFTNGCTAPAVTSYTGTYTRSNGSLTLVDPGTAQETMWTYSGDKLTVTDSKNFSPPAVLVFTKDAVTQPRS